MSELQQGRAPRLTENTDRISQQIKSCRICLEEPIGAPLPHEPRPVAVLSTRARIVICGQAPGNRVHQSGRPFTDPSGVRLREWLGVDESQFYDSDKFAIVPMAFCFPGYDKNGGDLPPRRECALRWHDQVFAAMPQLQIKLLVGGSAQKWHLEGRQKSSVTATVAAWRDYVEAGKARGLIEWPLPHPSWRNTCWLKKNPWFDNELLPELGKMIQEYIRA